MTALDIYIRIAAAESTAASARGARAGVVIAARERKGRVREPRDYTKWRETHFNEDGETIYELAEKIRAYTPYRRRGEAERAKRL